MPHASNNDNLRRLRYALELEDPTMIEAFALGGVEVSPEALARYCKRDDHPMFEALSDERFGAFLDGLIAQRRGKRGTPAGSPPPPPQAMTNNRVLRAIRIALELKDVDLIKIMAAAEVKVSKGEMSALFRRPDHKNYRACGDQFLRNFMRGLALRYRR